MVKISTLLAAGILAALAQCITAPAAAQDTITMANRHVIRTQVRSIDEQRVYFQSVRKGKPFYGSRKLRFVHHIRYADGRSWPPPKAVRRQEEAERAARRQERLSTTRNFSYVLVPALQLSGAGFGFGGGLGYERLLPHSARWTAAINGLAFFTSDATFGRADDAQPYSGRRGFYVAPGVQYHPFGKGRRLDFSIGIDVPLGRIKRTDYRVDSGVHSLAGTETGFLLATELHTAIRLHTSNAGTIMLTVAGGPVLIDNARYGAIGRVGLCFGIRH